MMKKIFENKEVKKRFCRLFLCAIIGIGFIYFLGISKCFLKTQFDFLDNQIFANLFLLLLYLPIAICLWFFRNKDRLEQINFNNFSNAMQLFAQENKTAKAIGLQLLMELRRKNLYEKQIDLATQNSDLKNLDLEGADLSRGNFKGANLENANLKNANLKDVNLEKADLLSANLQGANLYNANLKGANLYNANLKGANLQDVNLENANLQDAKLNRIHSKISDEEFKNIPKNNIPRKEIENFLTKSNFFTYEATVRIIITQETDNLYGTYKILKIET